MTNTRRIDIDAARAARAEARKGTDPVELVVGGKAIRLADEAPLEVLEAFGALVTTRDPGAIRRGLDLLVGDKGRKAIDELDPPLSIDDALFAIEAAFDAYGIEADPSTASS